jgi:ketosteroid isomerase-like protein
MSEKNVEIVSRLIEANRSDDFEATIRTFIALCDPDWEYTRVTAQVEPGTYRGHDDIRRYLTDMAEVWEEWRSEPEEVFEVGPDTVVATVRFHGIGKASGAPVEVRLGFAVTLSDGTIMRARTYPSRKEALEAAGLRE